MAKTRCEELVVRVITRGPKLVEDSNRSRKNYSRYAMTSKNVFFNMPAVKRTKTRHVPIIWTDEDGEGVLYLHKDAFVIKATVVSKKFDRILVDLGSLVDVIFKSTFDKMRIVNMRLEHTKTSLKGFSEGRTPFGMVELPIIIGSVPF